MPNSWMLRIRQHRYEVRNLVGLWIITFALMSLVHLAFHIDMLWNIPVSTGIVALFILGHQMGLCDGISRES